MAGKTKRSIDDIKKLFEERNYKLLSNEYINNVQKLKYICPKHNDVVQSISLNNFLRGAGCKYCGRERSAEKHKKYNIDIIKKLFLKKDYVLLSTEYKDIYSPLEYICNKQYHDKLKNEYCKKNNIKLFRIPYYYFDFLDLILEVKI